MAAHLYLTTGHLSNIFTKYVGVSPKKYLSDARLQKSCDFLAETDYKIAKIGELVGYDDSMQFSKPFKKCVGMSPAEYKTVR